MGHDDDWNAYRTAMQAHDSGRMRELELKADGLGVLTLEHLGISPERLVSAVQKMMRYNDWRDRSAGATPQSGNAPGTGDRYVVAGRPAGVHPRRRVDRWADWPATEAVAGLGPERR